MADAVENIEDQSSKDDQSPNKTSPLKKMLKAIPIDLIPLVVLIVVIFVVILYANEWKLWDGLRPIEETNDAYVRADVTPLSTKVSGTVARVLINDFDQVKKNQMLVELRDDDFIAKVNQAKADYQQSLANIESVKNQIDVQTSLISNASFTVNVGEEEITKSKASVGATEAFLQGAKDALAAAISEKAAAVAKLKADQAIALRAHQERERQVGLFADDASTQQTIEQVVADDDRAKAVVIADQAEIDRLTNQISARASEIKRQREELKSAGAQTIQSRLSVSAKDALLLAEKQKLEVLKNQLKEALAQAQAKLASVKLAEVDLDYTKIRAPEDGSLSERRVRAGQQVNAGTQVVTIVSAVPWVVASFRETQMKKMAVGDKAEVSVDALGSQTLKGVVQSISPASEAQFALLPPDNPSGNFTKITQRMPVKIVLDSEQQGLSKIRSGQTVIARVWTH